MKPLAADSSQCFGLQSPLESLNCILGNRACEGEQLSVTNKDGEASKRVNKTLEEIMQNLRSQ